VTQGRVELCGGGACREGVGPLLFSMDSDAISQFYARYALRVGEECSSAQCGGVARAVA
jgi:hypothetical protein